MDPEITGAAASTPPSAESAAPPPMSPDGDGDEGNEDGGDTGPLEAMHIEPAEEGGAVVTHHPKVPERVKAMGHKEHKPRVHVVKSHKELVEHIEKHGKRLKP